MSFLDDFRDYAKIIKEEYPSLKKWSDSHAVLIWNSIQEQQILQEFVTQTIPIDKTIETLKKRFGGMTKEIAGHRGEHGKPNFIVIKYDHHHFDSIEKINKYMDAFGWFASSIVFINREKKQTSIKFNDNNFKEASESKWMTIQYDAKYDVPVELKERYLYHVTPDINWSNIHHIGLTPKNRSKLSTHIERIYFFLHKDEDAMESICIDLYNNLPPATKTKVKKYIYLQIDTSKLNDKVKFYNDPNALDFEAVWTFQNIPPNCIQQDGEYEPNPTSN